MGEAKGEAFSVNAEVIAVGTELLLGQTVDTNSAEISRGFADLGINVYFHSAVGDNAVRFAAVLAQALIRSQIVVVTGGLGPTEDDITRETLAAVTGRALHLDPMALNHVESYFSSVNREMTDNNRRQAMLPEGAEMLDNPRGTAPGIYLAVGNAHVFCVPGVPTEMRTMWQEEIRPRLGRITGGDVAILSRTLRFYGIGESSLETRIQDLLHTHNPTVAPYAGLGEVRLRITARADSERDAKRLIDPVEAQLLERAGEFLYGYGEVSLEEVLGGMLSNAQKSISTAESCTGGLVAHRLTNIPGSSAYFKQGWTTYSNEAKVEQLGVPAQLIEEHGAVSQPVARAMAEGALRRAKSSVAVAVTGVAGPGGGTEEKPVGLVWFGVATAEGEVKTHQRRFRGRREDIKWRSASEALNLVRTVL